MRRRFFCAKYNWAIFIQLWENCTWFKNFVINKKQCNSSVLKVSNFISNVINKHMNKIQNLARIKDNTSASTIFKLQFSVLLQEKSKVVGFFRLW